MHQLREGASAESARYAAHWLTKLASHSPFSSSPRLRDSQDFVVSGTASEKLFGMAESLWEPDLEADDLFETISQTLLNAVDRDAYSGWGAVVWIIEKVSLPGWACRPPSHCSGRSAETSSQTCRLILSRSQDKVTKRWLKARMD